MLRACFHEADLVRWLTRIFLVGLFFAQQPRSISEAVWQIGQIDRSSAEFRQWIDPITQERLNYSDPASDPVFMVGRSAAGRDWPAFQPGSANGGAGFRTHPFTLEFELPAPPARAYRLNLALLAYSARLPALEVQVNGRKGRFYQDPKLNYEGGDSAVFFLPYYSTAEVQCEFPGEWLQPGTNRIILTALDVPPKRDDTRPAGFPWPGSSGIHYDAIRLETIKTVSSNSVKAVPTIFYLSGEGLQERIDVWIMALSPPKQVVLQLGNRSWTNSLLTDSQFGQWRSEFLIPEVSSSTNVTVSADFGTFVTTSVQRITPARKWTLFVVPNVHVDIGYTDYAAKVSEIQSRILDEAILQGERNPNFRFTPDGFWPIEEFVKGRTVAQKERLIQAIRNRIIALPAVHTSTFTGFSSLENLVRGLYPSRRFAVEHKLPFEFALNTDVPSYSWSLVSVLAASGVRFFAGASDAYRAPFLLYNRLNEESPHWWEGPDGARVLTWYSRHYHQLASLFGLPYNLENGLGSLPRFLQAYDRPGYRANAAIVYGSQVENVELHSGHATLVNEWNSRYAYPRLQYASFPEALRFITNQFGTNLTVVRGDGGPYWEDGLGANARITALARSNMYRILSAEKGSTLAHLADSRVRPETETIERAWHNLLLTDEHTWHADQSVREPTSQQSLRQGALKNSRAIDAARQIEHVTLRGLAVLANQIKSPPGSLIVFNSLSWSRSGFPEIDLPHGLGIFDPESGRPVAIDRLHSGNGFDHVRFEASAVPPVGYKTYSLRPAVRNDRRENLASELSNRFYVIKLDATTGGILSIWDRELGRELVSQNASFGWNEYLFVSGGDALPNRLIQYSSVSPLPQLEVHRSGASSRLVSTVRTPLGSVARIRSSAMNTPRVETRLFLPDNSKRIEFENSVTREYSVRKEAAYFAFPFEIAAPLFQWATQNGLVDPTRDLLNGACREWFLAHQWVKLRAEGMDVAWVPVEAPLFTVGDIVRGKWPQEFGSRPATLFSYIMNNYTPEGYQAGQEGEHTFHYVLTSGPALAPEFLHRLGMEALTPLETVEITRNDKSGRREEWLPGAHASFLEIQSDHFSLINWKVAEFGEGTILRLLETGGRAATVALRFPWHQVDGAAQCSAVEEELSVLPVEGQTVTLQVRPHEIVTVKVRLQRVPKISD